LLNPLLI